MAINQTGDIFMLGSKWLALGDAASLIQSVLKMIFDISKSGFENNLINVEADQFYKMQLNKVDFILRVGDMICIGHLFSKLLESLPRFF